MTYSEAGLALTKSFEGLRLRAYRDGGGVWTIGYGHVGAEVREGLCVDEECASAWLLADVQGAVRCVNAAVTRELLQRQFDALVDFCFNVGCGAWRGSELLRLVNAGAAAAAHAEFARWTHVAGKASAGLERRRAAEAAMFAGGAAA